MVLTHYAPNRAVRLVVHGTAEQLEPIGRVLRRLFPAEVTVTSDEDEADQAGDALSPDQIALLTDIADYNRELAHHQTPPTC